MQPTRTSASLGVRADVPHELEQSRLEQILAHLEAADRAENDALCRFMALVALRFKDYQVDVAAERCCNYLRWRRSPPLSSRYAGKS